MAPLQPALVESDARAMVAAVQRRIRRRALVVLMTDLNASALDEGLIHSQSLFVDAPQGFDGYRPGNFDGHYRGPVGATRPQVAGS